MNFKKWWALSACLTLCFMLISLVIPVRASADSFYFDGYYTIAVNNFPISEDYYNPFASPVVNDSVSIPSGYSLVAYGLDVGSSSANYPYSAFYFYTSASNIPFRFYTDSQSRTVYIGRSSGSNFFIIENSINSEGVATFRRTISTPYYTTGRVFQATAFVDTTLSNDSTINRPESQISFSLNTAIVDYNLSFNCSINSGDPSIVDYYIFPSSVSIPSGASSGFSGVPATQLTQEQQQSLITRGYRWIIDKYNAIDSLKETVVNAIVPDVSSFVTVSTRGGSGSFNPDSFNTSYEKIGSSRLYDTGQLSLSTTASINLKAIASAHSGVYIYNALKLVAVVHFDNRYFTACYDFDVNSILGGSPVPPSTLEGKAPYPDFQHPNSDFKDLADYLKGLFDINNDNSIRNNNNLLANLMSIPWSNFIGTGFANGFANVMPELSLSLDSLFDSLFDKYSAPSAEQINALIADVSEERAYIRQKLAFVADVKQEVFFIQSTFVSAGDNPRPFTITLPTFMMGYKEVGHQEALVRYDLISNTTRQAMHNVIIVFCSLAVVMHIWHTLPATVGSMPKGD